MIDYHLTCGSGSKSVPQLTAPSAFPSCIARVRHADPAPCPIFEPPISAEDAARNSGDVGIGVACHRSGSLSLVYRNRRRSVRALARHPDHSSCNKGRTKRAAQQRALPPRCRLSPATQRNPRIGLGAPLFRRLALASSSRTFLPEWRRSETHSQLATRNEFPGMTEIIVTLEDTRSEPTIRIHPWLYDLSSDSSGPQPLKVKVLPGVSPIRQALLARRVCRNRNSSPGRRSPCNASGLGPMRLRQHWSRHPMWTW